ncbi:hypothetical protein K505DRAFT_352309 [Melanomma pulvis-pyrius CBS 109.77]|uniref:BHLH domain-containing protein n=1 Tax=Melanomma pulvis-pyrius CBS 109.77 TaxID=1314802 RepID=A0A6A6X129_9PLEO|nr:hypothetical protein K505DRAFT_352309 [Melanomma pulvis-pyrius CBS 109.77]
MVANTDYSPSNESFSYPDTFDKAYLADFYTTSPNHSLDTFLDCESFFDRPVSSVEFPAGLNGTTNANTSADTNANLNSYRPTFNPAPFGQLDQGFGSSFPFDLPASYEPSMPSMPISPRSTNSTNSATNTITNSPTPSLCGDGPPTLLASPPLSPSSLKRESPDESGSAGEEPEQKRPQRKRGRPRLDRNLFDTPSASSFNSSSSKCQQQQRTSRLPHNQVERKYREGLNSELERLRRAVPTLPQSDEGALMGQPKPSKAMVLAGAIEYIRNIERERDALLEENEKLGGEKWRKAKGERKTKSRRQDSSAEYLLEE